MSLPDEGRIKPCEASWRTLPHKRQILLIAFCRLSTPLSNACVTPYLYFLVKSIVVDPEHPTAPQHISRLTGLLVAAFPIGQMFTSMLWGRLSDVYGRKPIILFGLAVSVAANIGFGFSRSIGLLVFWRVIAGMANGIVGVIRTMTAEIVKDRRYQPRAFLAPPVVFNTGRVIALAVGGCLADPVHNMPSLFGPKGLLNVGSNAAGVQWALDYPYVLPAFFNAFVLVICFAAAALWLQESLDARAGAQDLRCWLGRILRRQTREYVLLQDKNIDLNTVEQSPQESPDTPMSPKLKIWTPQLRKVLVAFALLPLHNATFLHIFPVVLSMPTVANQKPSVFTFKGGLGLSSPTIGLYLALFGIAGIVLQLFLYPRIHQRIGTISVFRLANAMFPIVYTLAPYLALLVNHEAAKWLATAAVLFAQIMARTMAIPSSVLLLTDAAPHRKVLGTVHGAGNTLSAFASACGPAIGGVLLAKGFELGAVGLVWWTWLCVVSSASLAWSFAISGVGIPNSETENE